VPHPREEGVRELDVVGGGDAMVQGVIIRVVARLDLATLRVIVDGEAGESAKRPWK